MLFVHFIFYSLSIGFSPIWLVLLTTHRIVAMRNYISLDNNVKFHIMEGWSAMLIIVISFLLIAYCLLLNDLAYCQLCFANCLLLNYTNCYLLITFCYLPIAFRLLLIKNCFFSWYNQSFASMFVEYQYRELLQTLHCYLWKKSCAFQCLDMQMKWVISKRQLTKSKKQLAKSNY